MYSEPPNPLHLDFLACRFVRFRSLLLPLSISRERFNVMPVVEIHLPQT